MRYTSSAGDVSATKETTVCRSCADGGRRCSRANPSRAWRTKITERLARNRREAEQAEGKRRDRLDSLIARDEKLLYSVQSAIERYGECVTPHRVEFGPHTQEVLETVRGLGGRPVLVGDGVQDSLNGATPNDPHFEIHGTELDKVGSAIQGYGVLESTSSLGVLTLTLKDGSSLGLSTPQDDTISGLSYDDSNGVLIDRDYDGNALKSRAMHPVDGAFDEDPAHVMDTMQLVSRYRMEMGSDTATRCRRLAPQATTLSNERIRGAWAQWAAHGRVPSAGLAMLHQTHWDRAFPGLAAVNSGSLQASVDTLGDDLTKHGVAGNGRTPLMVGLLARDMSDDDTHAFIQRTVAGGPEQQTAASIASKNPLPTTAAEARQQAYDDQRATLRQRALVERAAGTPGADSALALAEDTGVADAPEADLIQERDVRAAAPDRESGPWVQETLDRARAAQYSGEFRDKAAGLAWIAAFLLLSRMSTGRKSKSQRARR